MVNQRLPVEMPSVSEGDQVERLAWERRWGLALILVGWLHLAAFLGCWYLTVGRNYHDSPGYLAIWVGEFLGMLLIFRLVVGLRPITVPLTFTERLIRRVWIAYFVLAFNLGSLNTLRGHAHFEFFPAIASLASFAFIVLAVTVDRRLFYAMLVMFGAGLLMAGFFPHAYLIFAVAWWLVLNGIGLVLLRKTLPPESKLATSSHVMERQKQGVKV